MFMLMHLLEIVIWNKKPYDQAVNAFQLALEHHQDHFGISVAIYKNYVLAHIGNGTSGQTLLNILNTPPADATPAFKNGFVNDLKKALDLKEN